MKPFRILTLLAGVLALGLSTTLADDFRQTFCQTSGTLALTGTAGASLTAVTLSGTGQSVLLHSVKVIVLSGTGTAPAVQLLSGTTVLTGSTAISGSVGYVTPLTVSNPMPVIVTGSAGQALTLSLLTTGTGGTFSGKVTVTGQYLP